ncbi:right-handed parallel beta-helix repeat-containing protein [Geothrix sp. 21YS21S-4]|uniref:right-handed parallel beta-helix repeat-containing protein n=1 Tax=Geothrix sp. 21YS21S-4 TaxID=3068889 RepID=UPI0027BA9BA1|nr:right-handed parallel beta-helix repeat-containing protein [Geothrix sp. 21YS21S-4]
MSAGFRRWAMGVAFLGCALDSAGVPPPPAGTFFVSPAGRDAWSGRLAAPSPDGSDGPFATLERARDAVRALKAAGSSSRRLSVQIRGGLYYFDAPVSFDARDSGTEAAPVVYEAFPGERPEFVGGRRLTPPSAPSGSPLLFDLRSAGTDPWTFRSLFVDGRREVRARYPNVDPADPFRKGFLHAGGSDAPAFGVTVGGIHGAGDWLEYRVDVPAAGTYVLWLHYGARNAPYGFASMDGRTAVAVDGGPSIPLADLADTGSWSPVRWARAAVLRLGAGERALRWQNRQGGGLVLDVLALSGDPAWVPDGTVLQPPSQGRLVTFSAKDFRRREARGLQVSGAGQGPKDAVQCEPSDVRPGWLTAPDAELRIFPSGDCRAFSEILSLRGYDAAGRRLLLGGPEARAALNPGDRYYVENVREELDAPGEWFLDAGAGTVAYLPRAGFSARSEVIAPRTSRLIQVQGSRLAPARYLRFTGLTFRDTDWTRTGASAGYGMGDEGAVQLTDAEACVVEDCRFVNIGTYAVCVTRGGGNAVQGCDVAHAGGGGVLVRESGRNTISGNHLHHLGEAYHHVGGVVLAGAGASKNLVSGNAIHDASRYGISLKNPGRENVIEFNRIRNTNLETADTGGIEVTQHDRAFRSGSAIRYNVVADTVGYGTTFGRPDFLAWGIYLDSFASGYEVRGNLVYRAWNGGVMLQGGRDNRVVNNVFVDGRVSQGTVANFEGQSRGLEITSNILAFSNPEALALAADVLGRDVVRLDRNLYFPPRGASPTFGSGGGVDFRTWRQGGQDAASLVADPRFRRPAADDFALLPDSPAFRLGFRPLPLERVGRCACEIRPATALLWGK